MTGAEGFWYVLMCIAFGAGYFVKIPTKKAMADYGLCELTGAEQFWYVLQCIVFGAGYFAKVPVAKALAELPETRQQARAGIAALRGGAQGGAPALPPTAPPEAAPGEPEEPSVGNV
ncbi:MAG: hypothetical protein ACR2KG_12115 [Nocardioidaceae bacterium]